MCCLKSDIAIPVPPFSFVDVLVDNCVDVCVVLCILDVHVLSLLPWQVLVDPTQNSNKISNLEPRNPM